jgi:GNAT superfamily N-acetyltransferase
MRADTTGRIAAAGTTVKIVPATGADYATIVRWAAGENRRPGAGDARLAGLKDAEGFLVGHLDHRLVCSASIIRYGSDYAHLGYLLAAPDMRGRGLERLALTSALRLAHGYTIGVDAPRDQLGLFRLHGFTPTASTIRYQGAPAPQSRRDRCVSALLRRDFNQVGMLDAAAFGAPRHAVAIAVAASRGQHTLVYRDNSVILGYGVLRPAHDGMRIGPLYADSEIVASALLDGLCGIATTLKADTVAIDVPDTSPAAIGLVSSRGLHPAGGTVRMYRLGHNGVPNNAASRLYFALTSLELG